MVIIGLIMVDFNPLRREGGDHSPYSVHEKLAISIHSAARAETATGLVEQLPAFIISIHSAARAET